MQNRTFQKMKKNKSKGLKIYCIGCSKPLTKLGDLLFSPPSDNPRRFDVCDVEKFRNCYGKLIKFILDCKLK